MKGKSVVHTDPIKDMDVMERTTTVAEVTDSENFSHNFVMKHVLED